MKLLQERLATSELALKEERRQKEEAQQLIGSLESKLPLGFT